MFFYVRNPAEYSGYRAWQSIYSAQKGGYCAAIAGLLLLRHFLFCVMIAHVSEAGSNDNSS